MSETNPPFPTRGSGVTSDERGRIAYGRTYRFVFDHPQWLMNILLLGIALIVPILGAIVVQGYVCHVWEALHRRPGELYPLFDVNRLNDYLKRGIWPFLVRLIVAAAMTVVILPVIGCFGIAGAALMDEADGDILGGLVLGSGYLILLVLSLLSALIIFPLELRAGFSQDLAKTFDFGWLRDFIARVGGELALVTLWLVITSNLIASLGMLLCCVGVIPASGLIVMAMAHSLYQLHELYLDRGGYPIPIKAETAIDG